MTKENKIEIPNKWNFSEGGIATLNVALGLIVFIWILSIVCLMVINPSVTLVYSGLVVGAILLTIIRRYKLHKYSAMGVVGLLGITTINVGFDLGYGLWTLVIILLLWAHEKTYVG